jgi:hypothetical protein
VIRAKRRVGSGTCSAIIVQGFETIGLRVPFAVLEELGLTNTAAAAAEFEHHTRPWMRNQRGELAESFRTIHERLQGLG